MSGEVIKGRRISSYLPIVGMIRPYDRPRYAYDRTTGALVAPLKSVSVRSRASRVTRCARQRCVGKGTASSCQ